MAGRRGPPEFLLEKSRLFTIRNKIVVLVSGQFAVMAGLVIFLLFQLNDVRIQGPLYGRIIQSKDLVADILPPPAYLVETIYMLHFLVHETNAYLIKSARTQLQDLEGEYLERHKVWESDLEGEGIRTAFLKGSKIPALELFEAVHKEFLPALDAGNSVLAKKILSTRLEPLYQVHRGYIDQVVLMANAEAKRLEGESAQTIRKVQITFFASCFLMILMVGVTTLLLSRNLRSPLLALSHQVQSIAEGDGDLTQTLPESRGDEFGTLARRFNLFVGRIRAMVAATQDGVRHSQSGSLEIARQVKANAEAVGAVSAHVAEARGATEKQLRQMEGAEKGFENQQQQVQTLVSQINQVRTALEGLFQVVSRQSSSVNQMGATIEEQAANIRSIAQVSQQADQSGQELAAIAEKGKALLSRTNAALNRMVQTTAAVGEFANIISVVAGQTNLLAMNAAIEAAHAGEAGKGFAVVADEIRKLADQSNEEAKKVKTLLGDVGAVSQGAQKELSATQTTFDQIVKGTRDVGEVVRQVRRAMEEQNLANQEMVKAVGEIVSTTETARNTGEGVGESTQVMALAAADLSEKTQAFKSALVSLKHLSHQISKSMDGVEEGVKAIQDGSAGVEVVVRNQNQSMGQLAELVDRFKVGELPPTIEHKTQAVTT